MPCAPSRCAHAILGYRFIGTPRRRSRAHARCSDRREQQATRRAHAHRVPREIPREIHYGSTPRRRAYYGGTPRRDTTLVTRVHYALLSLSQAVSVISARDATLLTKSDLPNAKCANFDDFAPPIAKLSSEPRPTGAGGAYGAAPYGRGHYLFGATRSEKPSSGRERRSISPWPGVLCESVTATSCASSCAS